MDPQLSAKFLDRWEDLTGRLNAVGDYLPGLLLRGLLGLHFHLDGNSRLASESAEGLGWLSGKAMGWTEWTAGLLLLAGLATRVSALLLLLIVLGSAGLLAAATGGSPGLPISGSGIGLQLLLAAALLPLLFQGGGRLSLDHLLGLPLGADPAPRALADWGAFGLAALLLGGPLCLLWPGLGLGLLIAGLALVAFQRWVVG